MRTIIALLFILGSFFSQINSECYNIVDGFPKYGGNISVSRSNFTCQRWDVDYPHVLYYRPSVPSENYCRNPSNDLFIWCYTTLPTVRWEECDIEECANSSTMSEITTQQVLSTDPSSIVSNTCLCPCDESNERKNFWYNYFNGNLTQEEKDKIIEEEKQRIKEALFTDPMKLSSYWRKKRSSVDNRPSAHSVGLVGGGFLCLIVALIVLGDMVTYCKTRNKALIPPKK